MAEKSYGAKRALILLSKHIHELYKIVCHIVVIILVKHAFHASQHFFFVIDVGRHEHQG